MIVPDWLARQAVARPDHPAVVTAEETVTFRALDARVTALAGRLRAAGVRRGDRVAARLRNGLALVELVHAVPRARAALVLLDPRLTPSEVARQTTHARVTLVIGAGDTAALGAVAPALAGGPPALDLDAPHTIAFTSGTSGAPKAVVLTAGNHLWSAAGSMARLGHRHDDRWLACMPLTHVGGLAVLLRSAVAGTTVVLHHRFDAAAVARALREDGITIVSLVPTMLARVLDALGRPPPPALRCVLLGGAGASAELLRRARARGLPVVPTYGLTEAASQVTTATSDDPADEPGAAGTPLLPTEVRVDPDGEILVRGPTVTPGYLEADGSLRPATAGGWLRTGDLGRLLPDGRLAVTGRRDDVIVTGGENVDPAEVEAALLAHPAVAEAAVAGIADVEWGQVVAAWVVSRPGARPTLDELRAACRATLAPHKLPRRLTVVDALPRTASGKVRRAALG